MTFGTETSEQHEASLAPRGGVLTEEDKENLTLATPWPVSMKTASEEWHELARSGRELGVQMDIKHSPSSPTNHLLVIVADQENQELIVDFFWRSCGGLDNCNEIIVPEPWRLLLVGSIQQETKVAEFHEDFPKVPFDPVQEHQWWWPVLRRNCYVGGKNPIVSVTQRRTIERLAQTVDMDQTCWKLLGFRGFGIRQLFEFCDAEDRALKPLLAIALADGESPESAGIRRSLALFGKSLRAQPGYCKKIVVVVAGRVSISQCHQGQNLEFLAGKDIVDIDRLFFGSWLYEY